MNKAIYFIFALLTLITISCASSENAEEKPEVGAKNGVCYSGYKCNSGLICVDMICKDDPCYQVTCKSWKECKEGACKLSVDRCESLEDCTNSSAVCDVHHNCISEENPCEFQTCSGFGKCVIDGITSEPTCNCQEGYNNDANPLACIENQQINYCENSNCTEWEECDASDGSCNLVSGRCGADGDCLNGKICDDNHNCIDPADPCKDIECNNHGTCAVVNDLAKCLCNNDDGYFRDTTGLNCLNPCAGNENCGGFGVCTASSATNAICTCSTGYIASGLTCVENNLCTDSNCSEWKPCDAGTGACVLAEGRCDSNSDCSGGKECDGNHNCITPNDPCEGQECSNHGSCVIDSNTQEAKCLCDTNEGYYPSGLSCLNPCTNQTCSDHGTCIPSNATSAICDCDDGYTDIGLTCTQNDPCANVVCSDSWKECRNGTCELIAGKCDTASDCTTATPACSNNTCIDLCNNIDCGTNSSECISDATDTLCICNDGYDGATCDICADGYQDTDNNGTCEPYTIWCSLQSPTTINQEENTTGELVFGRVYVGGITEASEASNIISAELGYTPYDVTSPVTEGDYFWVSATYNSSCSNCGNNDEYMVNFPTDLTGAFKYIYRFSIDNKQTWLYCDLNGVGGINNDPFEIDQVGSATITEATQGSNNTDLIISEYIEGATGNNKAIEIYNNTGTDIDLSSYKLWKIGNGGVWPESTLSLSGTLVNGDLYVICNTQEDLLPDVCDKLEVVITSFNGDDAIALVKNDAIIDVIGTDGADPGDGWDVAGTVDATKDHVLRRKTSVTSPNADWDSSRGTTVTDSEWLLLTDDFSNLGLPTPAQ